MKSDTNTSIASLILTLLHESVCLTDPAKLDWQNVVSVAQRNGVVLRLADRFKELNVSPAQCFIDTERKERERAQKQIQLLVRITQICRGHQIAFIFPKALQHYPDMGRDLDLFLLSSSSEPDAWIINNLKATRRKGTLVSWIAGASCYDIEASDSPLDIHHGRLGALGEHRSYLEQLMRNGREMEIAGACVPVASPEDQMVLQGMQRLYGRRYIRISDILHTIRIVAQKDLDWDHVIKSAKDLGVFPGLCCYLSYVDHIYREVFNHTLVSQEVRPLLVRPVGSEITFRTPYYRFPAVRIATRLYFKKFQAALLSGDLEGASRISVTPLVALTNILR
jgi:hypothetical protein